ncbi:Helix-turn-helix domain-containing protein [Streptococcus henryi]|uniref:Helix-turn-helix domain-containing protein n=1 Tax=Streptococcus henryi TaxID=439219 RepID=A0A1G6A114_9STRE|nr:Helix-turn-helix domain-containing protein [Streptococcus henryi]
MRWDYGKVFQEIRKSKGLTQEDVCQDFLARSTLARIESGNTIPKFDTMIFLLNQINMSLEEFKYICNSYHPSKRQEILNVAANYNTIVGTQELEKLKIKCQDYLKTHHDVPIEQLLDRLKVAIHIQKFGGYSKDKEFQATTQKIWSYLENKILGMKVT